MIVVLCSNVVKAWFGPHEVNVAADGYYNKYHMQPNLDEISNDIDNSPNIDYFRAIQKRLVDSRVGREISPAFYYRMSNVQLLFAAPIAKLQAELPPQLEALQIVPGLYGLVALTFFSYDVCDNDPYKEVSIAIVVRNPGEKGLHLTELIRSARNRSFQGYVLALPVTTELARVRGVEGYQLPKWLTPIEVHIGDKEVRADVTDAETGQQDISLSMPTPIYKAVGSKTNESVTTSLNEIDGKWHRIRIVLNPLRFSQQLFPRNVVVTRSPNGRVSTILNRLGASRAVRVEVIKEAQMVLHLPEPL